MLLQDGYYGFTLDIATVPANFYTYWFDRGVFDGCTGSWEPTMSQIISGAQPMFLIKATAGTYNLIDGLQYQIGQGDNYLRVNGDYPVGTYGFDGTVTAICGAVSDNIDVTIIFQSPPN